jgi:hypothetical protein
MMMAGQPVLITKRMIWGQGDGPRLRCVDSAGAFAQLACWESYNPLARYALIANGGQNHSAMHPGFVCRRHILRASALRPRSGHPATDKLLYVCLSVRRLTRFIEVTSVSPASASRSIIEA